MNSVMQFHEVANIFPMMSAEEFDALKLDIAQNGLIEPIWTYDGKIIDGRNRYNACQEVGIKPQFREYAGQGGAALVAFVVSLNLKRRHLNQGQLGFVAIEVESVLSALAKERQGTRNDIVEKIPQSEMGRSRDQAAAIVGTNAHYVTDAKRLTAAAPELAARVKSGEMKMPAAIQEMKRAQIVAHLEAVETKQAKEIEGVYDVIVIDPPWPMEKIEREERPNQAEFDYPTMKLEDIYKLEIPHAEDCHIWLWTTHKFLADAIDLLDFWGYNYVCTFVWHKPGGFQPFGLPQYNAEFALYARHGSPKFIDLKDFKLCFDAPRGAHSEKPEHFYNMVRRVTAGRRLDMFNRREIEGFDGWGKESK